MAWARYKTINLLDYEAQGLTNRTETYNFQDIGIVTIEFFKGFNTCVQVGDQLLPVNFEGQNPYRREGYGVYIDSAYNIHVEYEIEDE